MGMLRRLGLRSPSYDDGKLAAEVERIAAKAVEAELAKTMVARDVAVRDISFAALDKAYGYVKTLAVLVLVPAAILGFFGLKDATQFFLLINPKIDAAQKRINSQLQGARENEARLSDLNSDLLMERKRLASYRDEIEAAHLKISGLDQQVNALATNLDMIQARNAGNTLQQDFASLVPGQVSIRLDNKTYEPPKATTLDRPAVYLVANAGELTNLSFDEVGKFSHQLDVLGFGFVHGNFFLYRGTLAFSAVIVPFPQCTSVTYFDKRELTPALAVANALATAFKVTAPTPILIDLANNKFYNPVSTQVIEKAQIGVAASVASPEGAVCSSQEVRYLK